MRGAMHRRRQPIVMNATIKPSGKKRRFIFADGRVVGFYCRGAGNMQSHPTTYSCLPAKECPRDKHTFYQFNVIGSHSLVGLWDLP